VTPLLLKLWPPISLRLNHRRAQSAHHADYRELETKPRGIYTGCIGFIAPGRQAQFNVAIRTVAIDTARGMAEYGVGGGIVWDSQAGDEYQECQLKARILTDTPPMFDLLESILWEPGAGYFSWIVIYAGWPIPPSISNLP